jgi:inosine-uridine nucleoside N-ribohydrolase
MKKLFASLFCILGLSCFAQKNIPIILDTDIGPDYDDVGAMALLHAFADNGEATILATISCNTFHTTVPTLSLLNAYFNRPEIPIGVTKAEKPNMDCKQKWAEAIVEKYPHTLKANNDAWEAVKLYRKILSSQKDKSVTIISIGFFTNLANLLQSRPDEYSKLSGKQLIETKVKQLVSMAAGTGKDGKGFREYNVLVDAAASQKVFADWPTPILISGFEIGEKILTGARLIVEASIQNSPVKDAYQIALTKDNNTAGRNSWDQTAVLVAVRGAEPFFSVRKINFEIKDDGTSIPIPGEKYFYLTDKMPSSEVAKVIEDLMMHPPKKK